MKRILLPLIFLCGSFAHASSELEAAIGLFDWLEIHEKDFAKCEPVKEGGDYVLCDKTRVSGSELRDLFAMKPEALLAAIRGRGIEVELVCAEAGKKASLGSECAKGSTNKLFAEITALHGKYVPEKKTIFIRNSASAGSLIHEYIHALQSHNGNTVYGRIYKKERNEVQKGLVTLMDKKIAKVQQLESAGKKEDAKLHLKEFMIASDAMRGFALWQDLIDERGIFLLYLKYGREFGASAGDMALARKNMGFMCGNPKLAGLIPRAQCRP